MDALIFILFWVENGLFTLFCLESDFRWLPLIIKKKSSFMDIILFGITEIVFGMLKILIMC